MEINLKKFVVVFVVITEVLVLYYVYPKMELSRSLYADSLLSRISLNANDRFEAHKKSEFFEEEGMHTGAFITMYYADLIPKKNMHYYVYFDEIPDHLRGDYHLSQHRGYDIYFKKGLTLDRYVSLVNAAFKNYGNTDRVYSVNRNYFDADNYF